MFKELTPSEHMVLLMLYSKVPIIDSLFQTEKESLFIHTLVNKVKDSYIINTRGIAFVHQQRDPRNLDKYKKASLPFLAKLEKTAKEAQLDSKAEDLMEALVKFDLVKRK
jgi:hypothetical protein